MVVVPLQYHYSITSRKREVIFWFSLVFSFLTSLKHYSNCQFYVPKPLFGRITLVIIAQLSGKLGLCHPGDAVKIIWVISKRKKVAISPPLNFILYTFLWHPKSFLWYRP